MMLASVLEYGVAGGAIAVGLGGIEIAKAILKKSNGKDGHERRNAGFRSLSRALPASML